eukprot:COSAG02_NODE_32997_length_507_cov_0.848039_2_plen_43_part_01
MLRPRLQPRTSTPILDCLLLELVRKASQVSSHSTISRQWSNRG